MGLIFFIVKERILFFFRTGEPAVKVVISLMLITAVSSYGWMTAFLFDESVRGKTPFESQDIFLMLNSLLLVITVLRGYFPSYKPVKSIIPPIYPVSRYTKYFVEIAVDFIAPYFIMVLLYLSLTLYFSEHIKWINLLPSLISLISAHYLRRGIQIASEYKIQYRSFYGIMGVTLYAAGALFTLIIAITMINRAKYSDTFALVILPIAIFGHYFLSNARITTREIAESRFYLSSINRFPALILLLQHKPIRLALLAGFLFKISILFTDGFLYNSKGTHLGNSIYISMMFLSPVFIYTYVFNNTWGYLRDVLLTIRLHSDRLWDVIGIQVRLLALPVAIDLLVSASYISYIKMDKDYLIYYYLTSAIALPFFSVVCSLFFSKSVIKAVSMQSNTSLFSTVSSVLIVSLVYLVLFELNSPLFLLGFIIIPLAAILIIRFGWNFAKYDLFLRLYKGNF